MNVIIDAAVCRGRLRRKAFTLIELLVVVSIIALLVAILLPALGRAKSKASAVVCSTRIRGLGTATATYLAEYENTFPINGLIMPKSQIPDMYSSNLRFSSAEVPATNTQAYRLEYGALWPIMGGQVPTVSPTSLSPAPAPLPAPQAALAKAYLCPDDTFTRTNNSNSNLPLLLQAAPGGMTQVAFGPGSPGFWSYSVNAVTNSLGRFRNYFSGSSPPIPLPWIDPIKTSEIANPSNFIMFIEEDQASLFNDEVFDAPALGGGDRITNRHNNGGNLGFGDYHVEWVSEVAFDLGGGNASGTTVQVAMQSPWTSSFFPDPSLVPTQ